MSSSDTKVQSYTSTFTDVTNVNEKQRNQRNIGALTGSSSLSVNATLSKVNKLDFFRFSVSQSMSDIKMVVKATGPSKRAAVDSGSYSSADVKNNVGYISIQILDKRGAVVADSASSAKTAQAEAWQNLRDGKLSLDAGTYTIKITRAPGVLNSQKVLYAVALQTTTEKKAYSSTQYDADQTQSNSALVPGANAVDIWDQSTAEVGGYTPESTGTLFDYMS